MDVAEAKCQQHFTETGTLQSLSRHCNEINCHRMGWQPACFENTVNHEATVTCNLNFLIND